MSQKKREREKDAKNMCAMFLLEVRRDCNNQCMTYVEILPLVRGYYSICQSSLIEAIGILE